MAEFSHYNSKGGAAMVDISPKNPTERYARACAFVKMDKTTITAIEKKLLPKGDVFEVARIAGIMAAKKTSDLIPMCHPLLLTHVNVNISINSEKSGIEIESEVKLSGKTGVEMEALTAASVAALTIYDMCKAVDKNMVIGECRLLEKKGGKSDYFISS